MLKEVQLEVEQGEELQEQSGEELVEEVQLAAAKLLLEEVEVVALEGGEWKSLLILMKR